MTKEVVKSDVRDTVDVRVTKVEHSRRFLSKLHSMEYITTYLQEISQRIR